MRRGDQNASDVSESEVDQETVTDDVTDEDDDDDDDDGNDDRQPWNRDYERNMRRREWRRRHRQHRRGERCRGPGCRRHRPNRVDEEDNSDIIGTNENLPDADRPESSLDTLDSDDLPEPGVDRIPGRHVLGRPNRWKNRQADRQMRRRLNRNRQPGQRRRSRLRQIVNWRRANRRRQHNDRRPEKRMRYMMLKFCEYLREIGMEGDFSDICDVESTDNAVDVDTELPPEEPEDVLLEDSPSL